MAQIRYKITDENMQTYQGFQWKLNKWVEVSGKGELCTDAWIHCYCHPLLAVLHNPIHGNYKNVRLFECEVKGRHKTDGQMKEGWSKIRLIKEIEVPKLTNEQIITYGIKCILEVYEEESFVKWAEDWLSGKDRTKEAAWATEVATREAAWVARETTEVATEEAAWVARETTRVAAREIVRVAAWATEVATRKGKNLNLISIAGLL